MKKYTLKCKKCGEIECLDFTDGEYFMLPVKFAKNIQAVCKIYKKVMGETYYETTGEKPSESLHKEKIQLTHLDIEDLEEKKDIHTLGKILCWTDR